VRTRRVSMCREMWEGAGAHHDEFYDHSIPIVPAEPAMAPCALLRDSARTGR